MCWRRRAPCESWRHATCGNPHFPPNDLTVAHPDIREQMWALVKARKNVLVAAFEAS
jgi:hypothetical protein